MSVDRQDSGEGLGMSGGVEMVTSPVVEPTEPISHYFHQSPGHCTESMAAINRMRQNIQVQQQMKSILTEREHNQQVGGKSQTMY